LALGWRLDANGHLVDAEVVLQGGQPQVYLASLGRRVYALDGSGHIKWQTRTGGPVYALEALGEHGIVAGDDAGFVTLYEHRGRQVWQFDTGSRVTALHSPDGSRILAGGWDDGLTLLKSDGTAIWHKELAGPVSSISGLPNVSLVATLNGHLHAIDPSGAELWQVSIGTTITQLTVHGEGGEASILLGLQDGRLLSISLNGTEIWQRALGEGGPLLHLPATEVDGRSVILAGLGGKNPNLTQLSRDGQLLWRVSLVSPPGAVGSLDLDGDGVPEILAGLASGEVQAYDFGGRFRGSTMAGLPVWGFTALDNGSAVVLADVIASGLAAETGTAGSFWLSPPTMLPAPPKALDERVARAPDEAVLAFLGDVSPSRSMETQLIRYGAQYPWGELGPLLHEADLLAANLESVLTTGGQPLDKSYLLRAHPMWAQTLIEAGIDVVTLANNHTFDYGTQGLDETLSTLENLGVVAVGAGISDTAAHRPALFTVNGVRVGILAYAAARWKGSVDVPATDRLAWAEPARVETDLQAIQGQVDVIVILLHAGTEYAADPSPDQIAFAHAAIDAGADLVVGHHPHVTQTVERYGQGLIVYSLGDALFDIPRQAAMQGDLLRIHVTRQGLRQAELWPFWIEDAIRPRLLDDGQSRPRFRIIYP
jgi:poly-gamma-glutamate synthesis protein (capsule biosynthesis protein)